MALKVLIACGAPEIGAGIAQKLAACPEVQIVGLACAQEEVLQKTAEQAPDLLVFHVPSCGYPQAALFRRLHRLQPALRTLAIGCRPGEVGAYFLRLGPLGLSGCVCQGEDRELLEAVCVLGRGGTLYLCPQASQAIVEAYRRQSRRWNREET